MEKCFIRYRTEIVTLKELKESQLLLDKMDKELNNKTNTISIVGRTELELD